MLLIRALSHIPRAAPLLDDWATVLSHAYAKWRKDPAAELTRADALQLLDGDPERTRFAALLFLRERWAFGSGRGEPDDEWSQEIISAVRDARDAKGPAEILAARDRTEFPRSDPPVESDPPAQAQSRLRPLKRVWQVVSENTLIATVVGGTVVLLVGAYVIRSSSGGGSPDSSSSEVRSGNSTGTRQSGQVGSNARWEQAATAGARTFRKPAGAIEGPRVSPNQRVLVVCKVYEPEPESVLPDGYWYRLGSKGWNGRYYAPANSFWNGDVPGKKPYTHNTDFLVHNC